MTTVPVVTLTLRHFTTKNVSVRDSIMNKSINRDGGIERPLDQHHFNQEEKSRKRPAKRRLARIALYKAVIGHGHERILELGCGSGDLAYALVDHAEKIVATEIDGDDIKLAQKRAELWSLSDQQISKIEFKQMSALQLDFPDSMFDWVISTSMVEHLDPQDVERHLREVQRVLKAGGNYLIWCPHGLGYHENQAGHLTMWSYREWVERLRGAGFRRFRSTLTSRPPLVDARWKICLETILSRARIRIMWSHLGVRNVLLVATT
jgi:SAM-dependent methyltransferase